jgi:penicillin amidase
MQLPRAWNPQEGFIATANHNILPEGYKTPIAYEWASRYRIDRVKELLREDRRFSVEDFQRFQHDDLSKLAEALVPRLTSAAARRGVTDRWDVQLMTQWNRRMSRDQVAPTVFVAWAPALYRRVMSHTLRDRPEMAAALAGRPQYEWLEDEWIEQRLAKHDGGQAGLDSLVIAALDDAVTDVTRRFGADRAKWRYGEIHVAVFRHPLSARYDLPSVSRGGDGNTVYATGGSNFRQTSGASFREIIDLKDFDRSVVTNVPGQSADPRSPHYSDLLSLWGKDEYFPLVYTRARVEAETEQVLCLRPR